MSESIKKKKKGNQPNSTDAARGRIDANWQKLLSTNLMDMKSVNENHKEPYSGTYRRIWKKKGKDQDTVHDNMKSLNITANNYSNPVTNNSNLEMKNNDINSHVNGSSNQTVDIANINKSKNRLTKFLAMDCEMVGIGYNGNDHMLARVSIVNKFGDCVYDKFVKAREKVVDYRTSISGVREEDLLKGEEFLTVQKEVSEMIRGRVIVGHSLKHDLSVLFLSHPWRNIRDTSRYKPFRKLEIRRDVALAMHLFQVLRGKIHNPAILEILGLCVPDEYRGRRRRPALLAVPRARTNLLQQAPVTRALRALNALSENLDLFSCSLSEFTKIAMGGTPSLKRLAKELLGIDIQTGEHSSVEDARAVMQLYCTVAKQWESQVATSKRGRRKAVAGYVDCSLD